MNLKVKLIIGHQDSDGHIWAYFWVAKGQVFWTVIGVEHA